MTEKPRLGYTEPILRRAMWRAELTTRPVEFELSYRHPEPADCDALGELMIEAYRGTIDGPFMETQDGPMRLRLHFNGLFGQPLLDCSFVALDRERIVSASLVTFDEDEPLLAQAYTAPSHKNRGIAAALIQLSMNARAANGYTTLSLVVTNGNGPAEHLYAKLGLAPAEEA